MDGGNSDRGVSEVMGFILVFGMLVLSFTVYQGIVVPDQNRQVEFEHNQAVQGQFQDLRNAIVSTAATGSGRAVSVTLGATYPKRAIARNLGISGGSIQTTDAAGIRIDNVEALDGETRDYLDGTVGPFETRSIRYHPTYAFYSGAPVTMYENSIAYNRFGNTNLTITDQVVIDGRRITLIAIDGDLSRAQRDTVSVGTEAISASSNRVGVRNAAGERVNITIPTRLDAAEWEEILADEMGGSGRVEAVTDVAGEDAVNITMEGGVTYELRMAKVGVGGSTSEEEPEYITAIEGDDVSVAEGGTQKLVVEVRDRFNNPVSNVTVSASTSTGSLSSSTETTGTDGRATFVYSAPTDVNSAQDVDVDVSFDGGGTPPERVTMDVRVLDTDGSGGGGGGTNTINPSTQQKTLVYVNSTISGSNDESVTLRLNNTASSSIEISQIRFQFYSYTSQGSRTNPPESVVFDGTAVNYLDDFVPVGTTVPRGVQPITLVFRTESDGNGSDYDVRSGDFIIITVKLDSGDDITYFLGITTS